MSQSSQQVRYAGATRLALDRDADDVVLGLALSRMRMAQQTGDHSSSVMSSGIRSQMIPHVVPGRYRVHVPDDDRVYLSDHRLVTVAGDL